ncbi:MAG: hypothetical protein NTW44_02965 [Nitrospirae bacterium]|nr:hypothetical protein [Nitrospirota bacterium]
MWWLISSETVEKVKLALAAPVHDANELNGRGKGECEACIGDIKRAEASMLMDTGLHITDAVPSDYETDEQ